VTDKGAAQLHEWAEATADSQAMVGEFLARYSRSGSPALHPSADSA
jgi:hypothetical protein